MFSSCYYSTYCRLLTIFVNGFCTVFGVQHAICKPNVSLFSSGTVASMNLVQLYSAFSARSGSVMEGATLLGGK